MALDLSLSSVDLTRAVCDIHSVSGDERALADEIERAVAPLPHLEVIRHGNTIVARTDLGREHRVVIAGHIDTVPINANLPTRDVMIDGESYLWGRGTVDMKSGTAVQLKLAAELTAFAASLDAAPELLDGAGVVQLQPVELVAVRGRVDVDEKLLLDDGGHALPPSAAVPHR